MRAMQITPEVLDKYIESFKENITKSALSTQGDLVVKIPMGSRKATAEEMPIILVTSQADSKMKSLIRKADKEIAWHGLVSREDNVFTIYDILVFPQEVTACQANCVDDLYGPWVDKISNEDFNNMRMHGHSHVNMSTSPSATDTSYQYDVATSITDYYIFAIYNKKDEYSIWLYDRANNVMYDKEDINYTSETVVVDAWAETSIKEYVREYKPLQYRSPSYNSTLQMTAAEYSAQIKTKEKQKKPKKETAAQNKAAKEISTYERIMREQHPELYGGYEGYYGSGYCD